MFKIGCPRSREWKNLNVDGQGKVRGLENWTIFIDVLCLWYQIVNYFVIKLGQLIDIVMGNIFGKYIEWFWVMWPISTIQALFSLKTYRNYLNDYYSLSVFTALKVCTKTKLTILYCHFIKIIKGLGTSLQSSQ